MKRRISKKKKQINNSYRIFAPETAGGEYWYSDNITRVLQQYNYCKYNIHMHTIVTFYIKWNVSI